MDMLDNMLDDVLESSLSDIDDLDSLLIDGVDDEDSGALEGATFDTTEDELTPAEESAIFLDAMYSSCNSPEEFIDMVEENATVWEMYGLIQDATAATEAVKRMKIDNWKKVNLDRVAARESIRLAQKNKSADYKKYVKYRALFKKYRDKILKRFGVRSKSVARRAIASAKTAKRAKSPLFGAHFVKSRDLFIESFIGRFTAQPPAFKIAPRSRLRRLRYARSMLGRDTTRIRAMSDPPICHGDILESAAIKEAAAAPMKPTPMPMAAMEPAKDAAAAESEGF